MALSQLEEAGNETWAFRVTNGFHLDAAQRAKSIVSKEHSINYEYLSARVVKTRWSHESNLVVVIMTGP